jgi:hypothetical protein
MATSVFGRWERLVGFSTLTETSSGLEVQMSSHMPVLRNFQPALRLLVIFGILLSFVGANPYVALAAGCPPQKTSPFERPPSRSGSPFQQEEEVHSIHETPGVVQRQARKHRAHVPFQARTFTRSEDNGQLAHESSWLRARNASLPPADHLSGPRVLRGPPTLC